MKKYLAVAVILLFIGLAFAPSINANVSKGALVEFTTELCGLDGGKQTVKLTQQQSEKVEELFDSIRQQLNETESREEAEEIFKDAVVELDKYGLLGGLNVMQAQQIIIKGQMKLRAKGLVKKSFRNYSGSLESNENMLCSIIGETTETYVEGRVELFLARMYKVALFLGPLWFLVLIIYAYVIDWSDKNPISIINRINLGYCDDEHEWPIEYYYSNGWVKTSSENGVKSFNGTMKGDLPFGGTSYMSGPITLRVYYPAVAGFTGIKINKKITDTTYFIGFALRVKIEEVG